MDESIRTYLNYLKYYEMYVEKNTEAFPAWALEKKKKKMLVEFEAISMHLEYVLRTCIYSTYGVREPPNEDVNWRISPRPVTCLGLWAKANQNPLWETLAAQAARELLWERQAPICEWRNAASVGAGARPKPSLYAQQFEIIKWKFGKVF